MTCTISNNRGWVGITYYPYLLFSLVYCRLYVHLSSLDAVIDDVIAGYFPLGFPRFSDSEQESTSKQKVRANARFRDCAACLLLFIFILAENGNLTIAINLYFIFRAYFGYKMNHVKWNINIVKMNRVTLILILSGKF